MLNRVTDTVISKLPQNPRRHRCKPRSGERNSESNQSASLSEEGTTQQSEVPNRGLFWVFGDGFLDPFVQQIAPLGSH